MDIFEPRKNLRPYEYPELIQFSDAVRHSYWVHTEFNFTSDVHDFKTNTTESEREALKRTMLAISQVEVAVKSFWGKIGDRLPKPEIAAVGATFAESEVRHADAYAHLLEILGLNSEFEHIYDLPVFQDRLVYLDKALELAATGKDEDYFQSILLFSVFIEHISLFSQFLIMMSFNKHKNLFKGISNAVEATSKEENIHGLFGLEIINIIRREHPEWEYKETIKELCLGANQAEEAIIDWIFEEGELDFLSKDCVKEFIKYRFNKSLSHVDVPPIFEINDELVEETEWFDNEVIATKHVDFFHKRSINYNKKSASVTSDDLF